jgi:hypothetical protein
MLLQVLLLQVLQILLLFPAEARCRLCCVLLLCAAAASPQPPTTSTAFQLAAALLSQPKLLPALVV